MSDEGDLLFHGDPLSDTEGWRIGIYRDTNELKCPGLLAAWTQVITECSSWGEKTRLQLRITSTMKRPWRSEKTGLDSQDCDRRT